MKKLLSILMSALLLTAGIVTLTACDNVPTPPEGYKAYVGEEIYFAYPDTWESDTTQTQVIVAFVDKTTGSNIGLTSEPKSDMYKNMTVAQFNQTIGAVLEQLGDVSNVVIAQRTNDKETAITEISYTFTMTMDTVTVTMKQYMYVFEAGNKNYCLALTFNLEADAIVRSTIFNSLKVLKS